MVETIIPETLAEALAIRKSHQVIPFAGGTDLMVRRRSWAGTLPKFECPVLLIGEIPELKEIYLSDGILTIGSAATLTSMMEHQKVPEILKKMPRRWPLRRFAIWELLAVMSVMPLRLGIHYRLFILLRPYYCCKVLQVEGQYPSRILSKDRAEPQ